jgi:hypothetical protein
MWITRVESLLVTLLLPAWLASGCAGAAEVRMEQTHKENTGLSQAESSADLFGIEPLSIRQAAQGHVLDFRYRIVNPSQAAALFERSIKPTLIDLASGAQLRVPRMAKVGPLKAYGGLKAGRTYFILFANPSRRVKPGARVAVVIGDLRLEGLLVE